MTDRLLTLKEVTETLRISPVSVYRLVQRGQLAQPLKFGRAARWQQSDVEAAIRAAAERRQP